MRFELALLLLGATPPEAATPPSLPLGMGMCLADHTRNSRAALAHKSRLAPLFSSLKPSRIASSRTMVSADSLQCIACVIEALRQSKRE